MPNPTAATLRNFRGVLLNTAVANITTSFLWFAFSFWVYLETRSVLVYSLISGSYMLLLAILGVPFGTLVDQHRKKNVMVAATVVTSVAYGAAFAFYLGVPRASLLDLGGPVFWVLAALILAGAIVESMRGLALSTCVTLLVPEESRANANGLVGVANGVGFALTSVFSGLVVGRLGMTWALGIAVALTAVSLAHLAFVRIPEPQIVHAEGVPRRVDFAGAYRAIRAVPGLMGLVLFATLNNLLGGVFMALMDPYGLTLVSVETWGVIWGVVSLGFLVGGAAVARWGLGGAPLRALLLANVAMWTIGALFTIRESIVLMAVGLALYMLFIPVAEAAEQTVLQTVVPFARQGRVFGFATSVEIAATPVSTFVVGPLAQFWLIPYAASDAGRAGLGWLLGGGETRGIALVFLLAGVLGLALTLAAFATGSYRLLTERLGRPAADPAA